MNAREPEAELAPNQPEYLINIDVDRNGRALARPGSIFFARLGEGTVLGLAEHIFESTALDRKLVAVVFDAYPVVNNLGPASDGVATGRAGFCPDVSTNGEPIIGILAADRDKFHFTSFLNRLYYAGSSIDYKIHEYDYTTGAHRTLSGVAGLSIAAVGNRLYVAGSPRDPNLIFPSDPDDPEVFNPNIAIQIGTRTDGIVKLIEHQGLLLVLGERSTNWVLPGAIELGDVQIDPVSVNHGIVGALAADEAGDGYVYWVSESDGPVRWRRGLGSVDLEFANDIAEIFETIMGGNTDLDSTVVKWDPVSQGVRFELPQGGSSIPLFLATYFPRKNAWTIGVNNFDLCNALMLRELEYDDAPVGLPRYSALAARRNPLNTADTLYGGDDDGFVWCWRRQSVDKIRQVGANAGTEFLSLIRWGNTEFAPVGYRAVIETILIDFVGGYNFEFDVFAELDYGAFNHVETTRFVSDGGKFDLLLLEDKEDPRSRLLARRLSPMHVKVRSWARLLGKIIRLQMTWEGSLFGAAFVGLEFERSLEAAAQASIQTGPQPKGENQVLFGACSDGDGIDPFGDPDNPKPPDDPSGPDDPDLPPEPSAKFVTGSGSNTEAAFLAIDLPPNSGENLRLTNVFTNLENHQLVVQSKDGNDAWFVSKNRDELIHYDTSPFHPLPAIETYRYLHIDDWDGDVPLPTVLAQRGIFYSDKKNRLYICGNPSGPGFGTTTGLLVYDCGADLDVAPTLISAFRPSTSFIFFHGFEFSDDELFVYCIDVRSIRAYALSADALILTSISSLDPWSVAGDAASEFRMRKASDNIIWITRNNSGLLQELVCVDVSNPAVMVTRGSLTFTLPNQKIGGLALNIDNTRAYLKLASTGAAPFGQAFAIVNIEDIDNPILVHVEQIPGTVDNFDGLQLVDFIQDDLVGNGYLVVSSDRALAAYDVQTDELDPTVISSNTVGANDTGGIGSPQGPNAFRAIIGGGGGIPGPLSANIIAITTNISLQGVVMLVGLDDLTAPTFDAYIQAKLLRGQDGPFVEFFSSGARLAILGEPNGSLFIYETGSQFVKQAELTDPALKWCKGLVRSADSTKLFTLNQFQELVEIDVTDSENPAVTSTTFIGPPQVIGSGRGSVQGRLDDATIIADVDGFALIDEATAARLGNTLPIELYGPKALVMDAQYAYCFNEGRFQGLTIVDHTIAKLPIVGKVEVSSIPEGSIFSNAMVKSGDFVFMAVNGRFAADVGFGAGNTVNVVDVSAPALPLHVAGFQTQGVPIGIALNGPTELVVVTIKAGSGPVGRIERWDITAPAAPVLTSSLVHGRSPRGCGVVNGKLIVVDINTDDVVGYSLGSPPVEESVVAVPGNAPSSAECHGFVSGGDKMGVLISRVGPGSGQNGDILVIDVSNIAAIAISGGPLDVAGTDAWSLDPATLEGITAGRNNSNSFFGIDLTAPAAPTRGDLFGLKGYGTGIFGSTAIIGRDVFEGGLIKLDVSDISAPVVSSDIPFQYTGKRDVRKYGRNTTNLKIMPIIGTTNVIVCQDTPTFRIILVDCSDKANPRAVSFSEPAGGGLDNQGAAAINFAGTRLYVGRKTSFQAAKDWRIEVYDISDVASVPAALGTVVLGREIRGLQVQGATENIFVCHGEKTGSPGLVFGFTHIPKVSVYNWTDAANPSLLGEVELGETPFTPRDMEQFS